MNLPIVACGEADRTAIIDLWHRCGLTRPWNDPDQDFTLALRGAQSTILMVRDGDAVLATIMVGFDGHRGWVYYLGVAPECRRRGLGRKMLAAAEAWLEGHQAPKIQLMIRHENDAAIAFYEALGYRPQPVLTLGKRLDGRGGP